MLVRLTLPYYQIIQQSTIQKMRKNMRHSSSLKSKNSAGIGLLENKLFSKLENLESNNEATSKYEDLDLKLLNSTPDALSDLIYRAKGITIGNQDKISQAKKQLRVSKKQATGTFLTGTGIYAVEDEEKQQMPVETEPDCDPEEMLRNLIKKNDQDDLAELRRMIKVTDQNLGGYSRQVHLIKKEVIHAATQFKSQMDFDLSYKLNRLQNPGKKSSSVARIRDPRYN